MQGLDAVVRNAGGRGAVSLKKAAIYREFLEGLEEQGESKEAAIQSYFCPIISRDDKEYDVVPGA
jgi:hypothetical protein